MRGNEALQESLNLARNLLQKVYGMVVVDDREQQKEKN